MKHPFVHLSAHGQEADIDVGMVDLILALWQRGITTSSCCEGDAAADAEGWPSAYVAIAAEEFPRFLDIAEDVLEPAQYAKRDWFGPGIGLAWHLGAQYGTEEHPYWANDMAQRVDCSAWWKDGRWHASFAVRFRHDFIPTLTAAVQGTTSRVAA